MPVTLDNDHHLWLDETSSAHTKSRTKLPRWSEPRIRTLSRQIITDERSYKFCLLDEDTLDRSLGAFKSLLAKRKELEQSRRMGNLNQNNQEGNTNNAAGNK